MSLSISQENKNHTQVLGTPELNPSSMEKVQPFLSEATEAVRRLKSQYTARVDSFPHIANFTVVELLDEVVKRLKTKETGFSKNSERAQIEKAIQAVIVKSSLSQTQEQALVLFFEHLEDLFENILYEVSNVLESNKRDEDLTTADRIKLASLNQRVCLFVVESVYLNNGKNVGVGRLFLQFLNMFIQKKTEHMQGNVVYETFLSGLKAQIAVMRTLVDAGYTVIVPDWQNEAEIEAWDVKAATDLIVINKEGKVLFLDVVGSRKWQVPGTQDANPREVDERYEVIRKNKNLPSSRQIPIPTINDARTYYLQHLAIITTLKKSPALHDRISTDENIAAFLNLSSVPKFQWKVLTMPTDENHLDYFGEPRIDSDRIEIIRIIDREMK